MTFVSVSVLAFCLCLLSIRLNLEFECTWKKNMNNIWTFYAQKLHVFFPHFFQYLLELFKRIAFILKSIFNMIESRCSSYFANAMHRFVCVHKYTQHLCPVDPLNEYRTRENKWNGKRYDRFSNAIEIILLFAFMLTKHDLPTEWTVTAQKLNI